MQVERQLHIRLVDDIITAMRRRSRSRNNRVYLQYSPIALIPRVGKKSPNDISKLLTFKLKNRMDGYAKFTLKV